jgi:hypothetical protein
VQQERHGRIHAQAPRRALAPRGDLLFGRLHRGDNRACLGQEGIALLGQLQAPGGACQQCGAQLFFQPTQRAADPGRGLAELFGGSGDRPAVDHGDEGLHLIQGGFHGGGIGGSPYY